MIDEGEASGNITDGEDCPIPQNATQEFKCHFVNATDGCQPEGLFNYLVLYYCQVSSTADPAILAFYIFWLIVLFITLGSTAEDFFCPSLTFISKKLKLKPRLAGVTLLAFGNGAPDVFSVLAAVQQKQPGLALGELTVRLYCHAPPNCHGCVFFLAFDIAFFFLWWQSGAIGSC